MIRPVFLVSSVGQRRLRRVNVRVSASTIEAATGLNSSQVAGLDPDDRLAIERAMRQ